MPTTSAGTRTITLFCAPMMAIRPTRTGAHSDHYLKSSPVYAAPDQDVCGVDM